MRYRDEEDGYMSIKDYYDTVGYSGDEDDYDDYVKDDFDDDREYYDIDDFVKEDYEDDRGSYNEDYYRGYSYKDEKRYYDNVGCTGDDCDIYDRDYEYDEDRDFDNRYEDYY